MESPSERRENWPVICDKELTPNPALEARPEAFASAGFGERNPNRLFSLFSDMRASEVDANWVPC